MRSDYDHCPFLQCHALIYDGSLALCTASEQFNLVYLKNRLYEGEFPCPLCPWHNDKYKNVYIDTFVTYQLMLTRNVSNEHMGPDSAQNYSATSSFDHLVREATKACTVIFLSTKPQ